MPDVDSFSQSVQTCNFEPIRSKFKTTRDLAYVMLLEPSAGKYVTNEKSGKHVASDKRGKTRYYCSDKDDDKDGS